MQKRQWVTRGEIVLASLREFQDDKCEIIQKYTSDQVNILKKHNLISEAFIKDGSTFDNEMDNEDTFNYDNNLENESNLDSVNSINNNNEITLDDIDFDDI